ncbi:MAG: hypothetical protein JSS49_23385 [Planctomycetes bacterium]|nr:hypothetical protein [Planctomycetota bacterium]
MRLKKSLGLLCAAALFGWQAPVQAQIVPGTGHQLTELTDDFEDESWSFVLNLPKASTNIDKVDRQPAGYSTNGKWFESTYRGTPDFVKRIETPEHGLPGSKGAMALQTLYSGIPGQLSHKFQQDDLIANVSQKLGHMIPATWTPSYVVRVYVPPFEQWEQRVGSSFGYRADCQTIINKPTKIGKFFRTGGTSKEIEQYWPGFFIQFNGKNHPQYTTQNTATILIRSGERGEDIPGPVILQPGWWTLGMTITSDGKVHYYGHPGVANLTSKDHLYSNYPYGYKCLQTSTFFFNVVNQDDGRTWSTRWIVDDPKVYVATRPYTPPAQTAQVPATPISQVKPVAPAATAPVTPSVQPVAPPVAPPTVPAIQNSPAAPPAAPPSTAPAGQPAATPAATSLPSLQSAPVAPSTTLKAPTESASVVAGLPPLSSQPSPVTPARAAEPVAAPAPALLPVETEAEPAVQAAPVIAAPAPAPAALPDEDAPKLPEDTAPALPPAPATPE